MKLWPLTLVPLLVGAFPALSQEPAFSRDATLACLEAGGDTGCIGLSAAACIDSPGGYTTVGMRYCLGSELQVWDERLNEEYGRLLDIERRNDAELQELGSAAPRTEEPLREMQRAWISFRDAACDYERAQWGGGTGGGPAALQCLMEETATQTLRLSKRLANLEGR